MRACADPENFPKRRGGVQRIIVRVCGGLGPRFILCNLLSMGYGTPPYLDVLQIEINKIKHNFINFLILFRTGYQTVKRNGLERLQ